MPKPRTPSGEKNLISQQLIELRHKHNLSQRDLAQQLQLLGYDIDKNVITRIETNKRYVTDLELKALTQIFHVSYDYLIDGNECDESQQTFGTPAMALSHLSFHLLKKKHLPNHDR